MDFISDSSMGVEKKSMKSFSTFQCSITIPLAELPVNTALVLLIDSDSAATTASVAQLTANIQINDEGEKELYQESMLFMEKLSVLLRPSNSQQLSRPMQRKLVSLINCQPMEEEGRTRAVRAARSVYYQTNFLCHFHPSTCK